MPLWLVVSIYYRTKRAYRAPISIYVVACSKYVQSITHVAAHKAKVAHLSARLSSEVVYETGELPNFPAMSLSMASGDLPILGIRA